MALAARHSMFSSGARRGLRGSNLRRSFLSNNSSLFNTVTSYWRLDEATGAVRVDDFGGNNLTNNNNVSQVAGKIGNASQLTLVGAQTLSIASNATLQTGDIDFTFAGWVYLDTDATVLTLLSKYSGAGATNFEYSCTFDTNSDRFSFFVSPTGSTGDLISVLANTFGIPSTATWYFIACWHDSTANTINISVNNGATDSTAHTTGVFVGTNAFRFGGNGAGTENMNGRLDAWGFWKRLLTAAERTELYANGNGIELFPWGVGRP